MIHLVFDYDGTIHETLRIYAPALRTAIDAMIDANVLEPREYTDEEISRWLGVTAPEMWASFAPHLSEEERQQYSHMVGKEMHRRMNDGTARLYTGTESVLEKLKRRGYNLLLLSNSRRAYTDAHRKIFNLDRFFSDYYCAEDFNFIPKHEIFLSLRNNWSGEHIVIGDRHHDMDVAKVHDLKSVGCRYGYGDPSELEEATWRIDSVTELSDLL
jgi:phosphoglycolate phosphatase